MDHEYRSCGTLLTNGMFDNKVPQQSLRMVVDSQNIFVAVVVHNFQVIVRKTQAKTV